ncbi:tetratricopeptide repeat protein [Candidatus Chloroploca sp. Khr17]|uniref:tetratricopeptide repeat protein n=1 Tax=Candidatus Chloroploca sp. Khr17 TaxID=2496869 RepID=UPI00101BB36A|nr:tetratricopeptide repeat protein [Candidatus Chloroploca sp. Khr17]
MPTFNKHGEIDANDEEYQQYLQQKEVGPIDVPEKQVQRSTPPTRGIAQRTFPPIVIAIGVGVLLIVGVLIGVIIGRNGTPPPEVSQSPNREPAAVVVASADTATPVRTQPTSRPEQQRPSATPRTSPSRTSIAARSPTPDTRTVNALNYRKGVDAYTKERWRDAADAFQSIYQSDRNYLDVTEKLSSTYYNWGIQLIRGEQPVDALDKFNAALAVDPSHQLALAQQQILVLYLDGVALNKKRQWRDAAIKFEELAAIQANFLDSNALLYDAYIAYGEQLERQGNLSDARRIYAKAVALPISNTSVAQAALDRLRPPPTPVPAPQPEAKRLRFRVVNYNDDPRCISVKINGITPAGWYFVVDGIGLSGRFDTGGNARLCGLQVGQEVTITVLDGNGRRVAGGGGIPSRGSAIMIADWR